MSIKRIFNFCIVCIFLVVFALSTTIMEKAVAQTSDVSINNNSFESFTEDNFLGASYPDNWKLLPNNFAFDIGKDNCYDGKKCVLLNKTGELSLTTPDKCTIVGGEHYRFGVKFLTNDLSNTCKISVSTYQGSTKLNTYVGNSTSATSTGEWIDVSIAISTEKVATSVEITITANISVTGARIDFVYGNVEQVVVKQDVLNLSIDNSDFESVTTDNFMGVSYPDNWDISPSNLAVNENTENAYSGAKCVQITRSGQTTLTTSENVEIKGGQWYMIGVKFRTPTVDSTTLKITATTYQDGQFVSEYVGREFTTAVANAWTDAYLVFATDYYSNSIKVTITINSSNSETCIDSVYAHKQAVQMETGASIRLSEDTPGMRFKGRINDDIYEQLIKEYSTVKVGMIIVPIDYFDSIGEFTFKALQGKTVLDIDVQTFNNTENANEKGYYGFNCAIVNILENNIGRTFCARSYVKYSDGNVEYCIYSEYIEGVHSRSIQNVAKQAMAEIDDYDTYEQSIIRAYANGVKPQLN